jgi:hypothetical protein
LKKIRLLLAALLFAALVLPVAAEESEYFVKTIYIARVYPHPLGYKVIYTKSSMDIGETFLPLKWFSASTGKDGVMAKGELIWGNDTSYPYLAVYWKGGKFSHVRLFLKTNYSDPTWGTMDSNADYSKNFDIEEPKLEF